VSSDLPHRHSIRLKDYDYSQNGAYFVTLSTQNRECLFGEIENDEMKLNEWGKVAKGEWINLPKRFTNIELDLFVIMPNHTHGIITIKNLVGVSFMKPETKYNIATSNQHMGLINQTPTLGHVIRHFKSKSSYEIHQNGLNQIIWQRNYYEHIIRNEGDLNRIREYIIDNPLNWRKDDLFML